jgi:predicted HTH domain antitoxin
MDQYQANGWRWIWRRSGRFESAGTPCNPSAVLRPAASDARALVTSQQQPAALAVALDRLGLPNPAAVRSGLALSLFRAGSIFVASASQVAGLPLPRFLEILSSLKIPVVEGGTEDLQEDLAIARRWLTGAP